MRSIPVAEPNLSGKESHYAAEAVISGWVSGGGKYVDRFEEMVAEATGARWAVAVLTGSLALEIALVACREGWPRIPMPSLLFVAAANAAIRARCQPLFVDIDDGWGPDISAVGPIFDAAPAIGSVCPGVVCFSFNGNKTITTGQGGAVVGNDPDVERTVRHLCEVAKVKDYVVDGVGYNARMSNVAAAIGCAQMERLPEFLERKVTIMRRYRDAGLKVGRSVWMALLETESPRDHVIQALAARGIEARKFWMPLHLQGPYKDCPRDPLPNTEALWQKLVCLPCSTGLTDEDQDKVIDACLSIS